MAALKCPLTEGSYTDGKDHPRISWATDSTVMLNYGQVRESTPLTLRSQETTEYLCYQEYLNKNI